MASPKRRNAVPLWRKRSEGRFYAILRSIPNQIIRRMLVGGRRIALNTKESSFTPWKMFRSVLECRRKVWRPRSNWILRGLCAFGKQIVESTYEMKTRFSTPPGRRLGLGNAEDTYLLECEVIDGWTYYHIYV